LLEINDSIIWNSIWGDKGITVQTSSDTEDFWSKFQYLGTCERKQLLLNTLHFWKFCWIIWFEPLVFIWVLDFDQFSWLDSSWLFSKTLSTKIDQKEAFWKFFCKETHLSIYFWWELFHISKWKIFSIQIFVKCKAINFCFILHWHLLSSIEESTITSSIKWILVLIFLSLSIFDVTCTL
jgi:hypothetical protein